MVDSAPDIHTYIAWFTHSDTVDEYYRHLTVLFVSSNDIITSLIDSLHWMTIYTWEKVRFVFAFCLNSCDTLHFFFDRHKNKITFILTELVTKTQKPIETKLNHSHLPHLFEMDNFEWSIPYGKLVCDYQTEHVFILEKISNVWNFLGFLRINLKNFILLKISFNWKFHRFSLFSTILSIKNSEKIQRLIFSRLRLIQEIILNS